MARHLLLSLFLTSVFVSTGDASPCKPGKKPSFCRKDKWKQDELVLSMKDSDIVSYAKDICTSSLQHTVHSAKTTKTETVGGPTLTINRDSTSTLFKLDDGIETVVVTEPEFIKTQHKVVGTVVSHGSATCTVLVYADGGLHTLTDRTVYTPDATVTETLPVATETKYLKATLCVGATSTKTIRAGKTTETIHNIGTKYIYPPKEGYGAYPTKPVHRVTETIDHVKTIFKTQVHEQSHVRHKSTYLVRPFWTTTLKTTTGTAVDYETTMVKTAYQTIGTVQQTVPTGTATTEATSVVSVENIDTESLTTFTGTTTDYYTTFTEFHPDWQDGPYRRDLKKAEPTQGDEDCLADRWVGDYGEAHFRSACSCVVKFPMPTVTLHGLMGTTVRSTIVPTATTTCSKTTTKTATLDVSGPITHSTRHTKATFVPHVTTKHLYKTTYDTVSIDGTTHTFPPKTVTRAGTHTVKEKPTVCVTKTDISTQYGGVRTVYDKETVYVTENSVTTIHIKPSDNEPTTTTRTIPVTQTTHTTVDKTVDDVLTQTGEPISTTVYQGVVKTMTVFVEGSTTVDVMATETVGVVTTTTVLTYITVGQNITSTVTTTIELESTTSDVAHATETCGLPIKNGGFEDEENEAWWISWWDQVGGSVESPGRSGEGQLFKSNNMQDYDLLEIYQDMVTCPNTRFRCTFWWQFDKFYITPDWDPPHYPLYVPYIRAYLNSETRARVSCWPRWESEAGVWWPCSFDYVSSSTGKDRFYFDGASPQPAHDYNFTSADGDHQLVKGGPNFLLLDDLHCDPLY